MKQVRRHLAYPFVQLKTAIKRSLGWSKYAVLQTYRGYITQEGVFIRGRLIEDNGLAVPQPSDRWWNNALATVKRYTSAGLADVLVRVECLGYRVESLTDLDGYFEVALPTEVFTEKNTNVWVSFRAMVATHEPAEKQAAPAEGELLNLCYAPEYGIVSDIDDTLLVSHSTDFLRKLSLLLRKNAYTRLPFAGAVPFYQALHHGRTGRAQNPFFYVSSSEWGLYDLLTDFCALRNIPKGVFLLRTLPNSFRRYLKYQFGNHQHKYYRIAEIMKAYPLLSFVLIGDSGQRDPEIYRRVVEQFPTRVLAIYIRDVGSEKRREHVRNIAEQLQEKGVPMLLVGHTRQAAEHAAKLRLIAEDKVREVHHDAPERI